MKRFLILILTLLILLSGCSTTGEPAAELPKPAVAVTQFTPTIPPTLTPVPTLTPAPTMTATPNPLWTIAPTLPPTPTPDPFTDMYIESLINRNYGGGVLEDLGSLNSISGNFSRRLFRYRSEGLNMYGFIDIPDGDGPFPVIIMLHGYVEPDEYTTLAYSKRYADALADRGYIVLHPNLRGYSPSPTAENQLGTGDTIDSLNLLALVRQFSGSEGLLEKANAEKIGVWGHSMGGAIVMRMLIVDQNIDAALLYAPINADEKINLAHFEEDGRGVKKISAPDETLARLSPINYFNRISAPISINQGSADKTVPVEWSRLLCSEFESLGVKVECNIYEDQPHTFQNSGDTAFIANMITFFDKYLGN